MSLTQVSIGHRLRRALLRGVIVGLLSSGNSVAEARDLIWTASSSQADSESIPLTQLQQSDSNPISSARLLTAEEFQNPENPSRLNWRESRDRSQTLKQGVANHVSEVRQLKRNTTTSSDPRVKQLSQSLSASSSASQLSSSKNEVSEATPTAKFAQNEVDPPSREELIEQLSVPKPDLEEITVVTERGAPAIGISVPSGFGATSGQFFAGLTFQGTTRLGPKADAGFSFGLGLGDPENSIGVDLVYTSFSTVRSTPFDTGSTSIKIHRRLGETSSAAIGVENFVRYGNFDADINYYGSLTNLFALRENPTDLFGSLAVTLGLGSGRFRELPDIREDNETINIFASAGLRVSEQFSLVGAYTGNTITLGASVAPFKEIPLVITPSVTDLTGEFDPRFILTIGYGTSLF